MLVKIDSGAVDWLARIDALILRNARAQVIARLARYIQHAGSCASLRRPWWGKSSDCDCGRLDAVNEARGDP